MTLRILVVGAGAVGGYFGARLAEAGRDVTFLVRPTRAEQLRRDGLRVISPHGDLAFAPTLLSAKGIGGPYDVILLSVKAYALPAAMDDFRPAVGPDTMILPVLNGMQHIASLVEQFGEGPMLGGVCLVNSEVDDQGTHRAACGNTAAHLWRTPRTGHASDAAPGRCLAGGRPLAHTPAGEPAPQT